MDYQAWTDKAIEYINGQVQDGDEFTLKSVFSGVEWGALGSAQAQSFGRYFANEIKERKIPGVMLAPKQTRGPNKYIRVPIEEQNC